MIATPTKVTGLATEGYTPTGWAYQVCRRPPASLACPAGTPTPYGGVRLALQQGDTLHIRLVNALPPIDPHEVERLFDDPLLRLNPTNLHTHGLIVDATPNSAIPPQIPRYGDFVFTSVFNPANGDPAAIDPTTYSRLHAHGDVVKTGVVDYAIRIPANHPSGAFWFHPHMHGIALNQLSAGLSGVISIGNVAATACLDAACNRPVTEDQVRHLIFKDMQVRATPDGGRPQFQSDPEFCDPDRGPGEAPRNGVCAATHEAAEFGGKWFFTVNGQRYPTINVAKADGEVWRLQNAMGSTSFDLSLVDNRTRRPMAVQLLSMDGISINLPGKTSAEDLVTSSGSRFKLAPCPGAASIVPATAVTPICISELFMMPSSRAEIWVTYRDETGAVVTPPAGATATLRTAAYGTGPIGDTWPAINLAHVDFTATQTVPALDQVFVQNTAAALTLPGGMFDAPNPAATSAPVAAHCAALAPGHRRRIYFGNPGTGGDVHDDPIFGLGYEEIDETGTPVPGTLVNLTRFNPAQEICLPLAAGNRPAVETWEAVNLTGELHNFHIHQTKFKVLSASAPVGSVLASASPVGAGILEDNIPLPFAHPVGKFDFPPSGSCSIDDVKAGRCAVSPIVLQIPFSKTGRFVYHCHILEHEDGGMMHAIRVVPAAN